MTYEYKCPECGSHKHLEVVVNVTARLIQYDDNIETDIEGDHEWGDESLAHCTKCNWHGEVYDLREHEEGDAFR